MTTTIVINIELPPLWNAAAPVALPDGKPTPEFQRYLAQQRAAIAALMAQLKGVTIP